MNAKDIKNKYYLLDKKEILELYKDVDIDSKNPYLNESLLHIACEFCDSEAVKLLIEKGINVNVENDNKDRALHALINRDESFDDANEVMIIANELLNHKASVIRKNVDGKTPVILAAEKGDFIILKSFVEHDSKLTLKDTQGNNALHALCYNMYDSKKDDFINAIKLLLETNCFDLEDKNEDGQTVLDIAVRKDNLEVIKLIQEATGEEDTVISLFEAIKDNNIEAITKNIENKVELNATIDEKGDYYGKTYLGLACYLLKDEIVNLLLEANADPNFKSSTGINSLAECLGYNCDTYFDSEKISQNTVKKIFNSLKNKGLKIDDIVDDYGNTLLNKACAAIDKNTSYNGYTLAGIIAQCLMDSDCDINKTNLQGQSPLMHICGSKRSEAVNLQGQLLEMDAQIDLVDKNGNTALMYACGNQNHNMGKEMVELLFEFGDPLASHVNNNQKTALDIAMENDNEELVKFLLIHS